MAQTQENTGRINQKVQRLVPYMMGGKEVRIETGEQG